jgi:ribosome biogenesis GTPase / thiamine phosphate phosphatase
VIDTPGMRELQLWDSAEGLERAFSDIEEFAADCRFGDCAHETEPGCAVQAAIDGGELPAERLASYRKLLSELRFQEIRTDKRARAAERRRWAALNKAMRTESY